MVIKAIFHPYVKPLPKETLWFMHVGKVRPNDPVVTVPQIISANQYIKFGTFCLYFNIVYIHTPPKTLIYLYIWHVLQGVYKNLKQ
jgi:hypothetical protein